MRWSRGGGRPVWREGRAVLVALGWILAGVVAVGCGGERGSRSGTVAGGATRFTGSTGLSESAGSGGRVGQQRAAAAVGSGAAGAGGGTAGAAPGRGARGNERLIQLIREVYTARDPVPVFRATSCEMERLREVYGDERSDELIADAERVASDPPPSAAARARAAAALATAMIDAGCDSTGKGRWYIGRTDSSAARAGPAPVP